MDGDRGWDEGLGVGGVCGGVGGGVEKNCVPLGINNRKAADNTSLLSLVNNLRRGGIDYYSLPRSAVSNGPPGNSHKMTAIHDF